MFDLILSACLIVVIPAYGFLRELSARGKPPQAKVAKYLRGITMGAALSLLLLIDWIIAGRSGATLGLDMPPSRLGIVGLALAAVVLVIIGISIWRQSACRPGDPAREAEAGAAKEILPGSRLELYLFILMSFVLGFAWEVLFRGYLHWWLQPRVGEVSAVLISATAYGLVHGYKSGRLSQVVSSRPLRLPPPMPSPEPMVAYSDPRRRWQRRSVGEL